MMNPDLDSEAKVNPFDLWAGAPFKLKMTRQSGFPNYDESTFLTPGPLSEDDQELEQIWKSEYSLKEITDPKQFKTYDALKARLDDVLGNGTGPVHRSEAPQPRGTTVSDQDDVPFTESKPVAKKAPAPVVEDEDEDPDLAEFRKLIAD
jgi:hypothetical protein